MSQFSVFVREVWGEESGYKNIANSHTVEKTLPNNHIMGTVEKLEKETGYQALHRWEELHPQEEAVGYFIAKLDVSELDMEQLQKGLPAMWHLLGTVRFALYQIDYTQDFSGVLDHPALAHHLVDTHEFSRQGDVAFANSSGCILDNTAILATTFSPLAKCTTDTQCRPSSTTKLSRSSRWETFGGRLVHYIHSTDNTFAGC